METPKKSFLGQSVNTLQDYLSIGYLFLLVLGILRDSIYFGFVDVNFLRYSSILDVLLSPISYLAEHWIIPLTMIGIVFLFILIGKLNIYFHKKNKHKEWYKKRFNVEKIEEQQRSWSTRDAAITMTAIFIFSFYLGTGVGGGYKLSKVLKEESAKPDHRLYFMTKESVEAKVIGQNSSFVFYIEEGGKNVIIAPISGNIVKLEQLN